MAPSQPALLIQTLSLAAAVAHVALAAFVLFEDPRSRANRLFAFLCVAFFTWSAGYGLFVTAPDLASATFWSQLTTLGWGLSPALLLHFFIILIRKGRSQIPSWSLALLYTPALVLCGGAVRGPAVSSVMLDTPLGWAEQLDPSLLLYWVWVIYFAVYCITGLAMLARWGLRARSMRERRCAWMIFTAGICSLSVAVLTGYAQPLVVDTPMPGLSHFGVLFWSGGIALAIRRYGLLALTPESAAQDILGGMRESVLLLDTDHRILFANFSACRLLGVEPQRATGRVLEAIGAADLGHALEAVLDGGFSAVGIPVERRITLAGGRERLVGLRALPMADDYQQLYGVALILDDLTARRQAQRRLERADVVAQRDRLASLGMLAASVAHEVNNPLGYVLANLEHLSESLGALVVDGQQQIDAAGAADLVSLADEAKDGAARVARIVADLSRYSRVEREGASERVDLAEVLGRALSLASNELRHRAQVVLELEPLPLVMADEGRLCQVFLNLIVNAAQSIPPEQADAHCVTLRTWEEPESFCIEVMDTGRGIAPEALSEIFEPFHSTKRSEQGSGLGLPISLAIVQGLGGTMHAYSELGAGSRFVVRLPRSSEAPPLEPAPPAVIERPLVETSPAVLPARVDARQRLLLVDDEPMLLKALTRLLSRIYDVDTAPSGREARRMLADDGGFDLVISDLMMAEGSGMELHDWMREHRPALAERMLFLTGGTFTPQATAFTDQVADRVLRKPVSHQTLLAAVETALTRPHDEALSD